MKSENAEPDFGRRFLWGVVFAAMCLFLALSLFTYDWRDISMLQAPPITPAGNLFGPVGAWFSYALFMGLGVGAFMVPVVGIAAGLILMFSRGAKIWPRLLWTLAVLFAWVSIIQLDGGTWQGLCARLNILPDAGGIVGRVLMREMLIKWLSPVGAGLLVWALFLFSIVMAVEVKNLGHAYQATLGIYGALTDRVGSAVSGRQDRRTNIEREERRLDKRRRRLERIVGDEEPEEKPAKAKPKRKPKAVVEELPLEEETPEQGTEEPVATDLAPEPLFTERSIKEKLKRRKKRSSLLRPKPAPEAAAENGEDVTEGDLSEFVLPGLDLLNQEAPVKRDGAKPDTVTTSRVILETLSEFGVEGEIVNADIGPVVTCYEMLPAPGVRVERISNLSKNLALNLKATSVRIQAPIPGKGVVGIEVPNGVSQLVSLRSVLEGEDWARSGAHLPLVLGKDVSGNDIVEDLADMPHLLIAGATGSGKTVCMNSILAGLLMSRTPEELRLLLVDPKIVEFSSFNGLPHLVVPVVTDPKKVALALRWAIQEMERRYKFFAKVGVRNIAGYNEREIATQEDMFGAPTDEAKKANEPPIRFPYVVIVIDELADLMLADQAEIENCIARLAQLSRAVGIHMIIATQRPSVNVITGTIKANFPARVAFQVTQRVDSRTILDTIGADSLLGRGDMLYMPPGSSKLIRAQGAMTTDSEIRSITEYLRTQGEPQFEIAIKDRLEKSDGAGGSDGDGGGDSADDELLSKAIEIIRETRRASTSSLQRRLRIGYTRAARIIDILEERGILGPPRGSEPREILIDLDGDIPDDSDDDATDEGDEDEDEEMTT
jgi:S-DNA-T family DNA segregation ATPase FtsK/SpoIIIE